MALSAAEEIALCQCLQIPYGTQINVLDDVGLADGLTLSATNSAKTAAIAMANALAAGALVALQTLLAAWIALGTDTAALRGGAIGGVSGIELDPQAERAEIQRQVQILVPYTRDLEYRRRPPIAPVIL
jgi:hypothetical protein